MFDVNKYFAQEFVCYTITPNQIKLPYSSIFSSIDESNAMYKVVIDRKYASVLTYIKLIVHSRGAIAFISKRYSSIANSPRIGISHFKLKYVKIFMKTLGYPYEKYVCSKDNKKFLECREACAMNASVAKFGRVLYDIDTLI